MIDSGINLRQARYLSDAYEADSDSIDDYSSEVGFFGFPPGSYPDSSIITLHKLLKLLASLNLPTHADIDLLWAEEVSSFTSMSLTFSTIPSPFP